MMRQERLRACKRVESDTCLCCVGDYKAYFGLVGQCHKGSILAVWVERTAHYVYSLKRIHRFAVLAALQIDMI